MERQHGPSIDQLPSILFKLKLELLVFQTGGLLDTIFIVLHLQVESIITVKTIHLTFLKQMVSELLSPQEDQVLLTLVSL